MDLRWLGCDLVSGQVVEELPDLAPSGELAHLLAASTSAAFSLPVPSAPNNWEAATEPGRSMLVAVLGGEPVWAGVVLIRDGGTGPLVDLGCVSVEGYLDRRYVGDHSWVGQDEASVIAAGLAGDANTTEGIGLTIDAPATGTLRDRTYYDRDDKTVYSALRELAGVQGGPEWTVVLGWVDPAKRTAVSKTLRVRERIGFVSPGDATNPTQGVNAVFSTEGESGATYRLSEDYTAGRGANHILAVSSGEGGSRPQSDPARDVMPGWPRWEHRFTPSTSITTKSVLDAHAASALALMAHGARVLTITARADAYPRLGVDWSTGDDIGYELVGHRHPGGLAGVARAVGWTLDAGAGLVSPILLVPTVEG